MDIEVAFLFFPFFFFFLQHFPLNSFLSAHGIRLSPASRTKENEGFLFHHSLFLSCRLSDPVNSFFSGS